MIQEFVFTIDDNIIFLEDLTKSGADSLFCHPYMRLLRDLHEKYGVKVQLNLFYEKDDFTLAQMTDRYAKEWEENADWLKLSFHSQKENIAPYKASGYEEVYEDCSRVHKEILRFAGQKTLAKTTTVHFCEATREGVLALQDSGVQGLLGLYWGDDHAQGAYDCGLDECARIAEGETLLSHGMHFAQIDVVLNMYTIAEILARLEKLDGRKTVKVMIHEQYFYKDYEWYQPDFAEKLEKTFAFLLAKGAKPCFFEEVFEG
jgi:hypothetical protein